MSEPAIPLDHDALVRLLNDPVMTRIVTVLNLASLSILEILEYGFTRKDVSRALAKEVIVFDKHPMAVAPETMTKGDVIRHVLETGDYYFGLLSSKVKLGRLGLYMLEIIEQGMQPTEEQRDLREPDLDEAESPFSRPASQL
jgi:hypothetical protein